MTHDCRVQRDSVLMKGQELPIKYVAQVKYHLQPNLIRKEEIALVQQSAKDHCSYCLLWPYVSSKIYSQM